MIIKINFKNNDFQELVENYLKKFNVNILYDLSAHKHDKKTSKLRYEVYEAYDNAYERCNLILNSNILYKMTADDYVWLKERIKASLKEYLLRYGDLSKLSKEYIEKSFINNVDITFPRAFYDKWENGEVGYWFSHSETGVIQ